MADPRLIRGDVRVPAGVYLAAACELTKQYGRFGTPGGWDGFGESLRALYDETIADREQGR